MYKVFYQDNRTEVPIRERTRVLYIDAASVTEVQLRLKDEAYNIEFIQKLSGPFLEYEKESLAFAETLVR